MKCCMKGCTHEAERLWTCECDKCVAGLSRNQLPTAAFACKPHLLAIVAASPEGLNIDVSLLHASVVADLLASPRTITEVEAPPEDYMQVLIEGAAKLEPWPDVVDHKRQRIRILTPEERQETRDLSFLPVTKRPRVIDGGKLN